MEFSERELRHLEELARLRVSDVSREKLRGQLARIIEFVRQLQGIDMSKYGPSEPAVDRTALMRRDVIRPCLPKEEVLAESPESEGGMFRVPSVIETGDE